MVILTNQVKAKQPGNSRSRAWTQLLPYLFVGPAMLYIAVFVMIPLSRGVQLSFTDTKLISPQGGKSVGVENYAELLTSERFWNSFVVTVAYTAAIVIFSLVLGTLSAVLVNRSFRGRALTRAILTFPYATPNVAVALIFLWMFNQAGGVFNESLAVLGIGEVGWLGDPDYGLFSVILATLWKVTPFVMLVVLAALQSVPEELYESARVDGADVFSTFRAIVLPHLMPTIRVVALLMTVWSIRRFEIIYLLTGGGPVETTNVLVINIYQQAFQSQKLGMAAAIGVLGLLLSLIVTVAFFVADKRSNLAESQ